jgi:hypothetical protein
MKLQTKQNIKQETGIKKEKRNENWQINKREKKRKCNNKSFQLIFKISEMNERQ